MPPSRSPAIFGVIEAGQDLAFVPEAADDRLAIHAALEDFDGDQFPKDVVGADTEIDGAHAAASELADQSIRPVATEVGVGATQSGSVLVRKRHRESV